MKRETIRKILSKWYSEHTINSILSGKRKPKYENILEMYTSHNIPFESWADIKSFINTHNTKDIDAQSSANSNKKAS